MGDGEIIQWLGCFGTPVFLVFGVEHEKLISEVSIIGKIIYEGSFHFAENVI